MQKFLAAVLASMLVASAAVAQPGSIKVGELEITGVFNLWYESARATGATLGPNFEAKSRDRFLDAAGSFIRFSAWKDIGGGTEIFGQVESSVFNNADTRNNDLGTGASVSGFGNRNSAIGVRNSTWGLGLIGIWDVHYNEHYRADSHLLRGTPSSNSLGLMNSFGTPGQTAALNATLGARFGNVARYQSPRWNNTRFRLVYARPTDRVPSNTPGVVGDNAKNRVYNFAISHEGPALFAMFTHLTDKDLQNAAGSLWTGAVGARPIGIGLNKLTSDRVATAYKFPIGFKVGFIYDRSKLEHVEATSGSEIKRNVWVIPVAYVTGPHSVYFDYIKASAWKGNLAGSDVGSVTVAGNSVGAATGARMISLGYQFDLTKQANVHLTYAQIRNDALAGYDFFAAPVGITPGAFGADPKVYSVGLRYVY